jgi:putative tricarboxylic transport membrane protein
MDGLVLVPVLIGIFVISEVLVQLEQLTGETIRRVLAVKPKHPDDSRLTRREFFGLLPTISISYFIGQIIGVIPGLGAAVAPWIAYGQVRSLSKNPESFGKGEIKGVAAAEAANNATSGANLVPLLTLGIPGSTTIAVIMSVFMLHGIEFGPRIFEQDSELVYGIFAVGFLAIGFYFAIGYFLARRVGELITKIPIRFVYPMVVITTVAGAYAVRSSVFDVGVLFVFGILGYFLRKAKFPLPPLVIAFIIGGRFERAFRTALQISKNDATAFLRDPFSAVILLLTFVLLGWNIWREFTASRSKLKRNP